MTGFSTPFGGALAAPLLMQLLNRPGAGGMPGSLAPQIPMLPAAARGGAGPVPAIPPAPRPPLNNAMGSLGGLGGGGSLASLLGGAQSGLPFDWNTASGLFGGAGPLFDSTGLLGSSGFFGSLFGGGAAGAGTAAALTSPEDFVAGLAFL